MLKKTTALLFISLAYLIIMVHAVVPHHHHEESIFIANARYNDHSGCHGQSTSQHDHEESCLLTEAVIIPSGEEKQIIVSASTLAWQFDFGLSSLADPEIFNNTFNDCPLIEDPESSYLCYASSALVLRAPPAA